MMTKNAKRTNLFEQPVEYAEYRVLDPAGQTAGKVKALYANANSDPKYVAVVLYWRRSCSRSCRVEEVHGRPDQAYILHIDLTFGVFSKVGLMRQFWLNMLLTILVYVPSLVHVVWIISTKKYLHSVRLN